MQSSLGATRETTEVAQSGPTSSSFRQARGGASPIQRYMGLGILVALFALWAVTLPGKFLTGQNLLSLLNNETITVIIALGILFPLAAGVFDISIAGIMTLSVTVVTL